MEEVHYASVGASLRAPRFVVAYRPDSDWVITARHVIRTLSRIWGGAGAMILPAEKQASGIAALAGLIRSYDPDFIAGHVPFPEGGGSVDEAAGQDRDGSGTRDPALPWHLQSRMIYADAWEDVAQLADEWSSPYKGVHQDAASFSAHEVISMEWHADSDQYLTVMPPLADEPPLITLDLDGVDPLVALMVESRTGALHAHDQATLHHVHLRVEAADLKPLVRLAITGETRLAGWDPGPRFLAAVGAAASGGQSALTAGEFMQRTPFARTRQWLAIGRTAAAAPPPVVCVIGDSAADHALAVVCDRLFHRAGWIPLSVWQDQDLASAAKFGIYELHHIPGSPNRPVLVTSISESQATLQSLITELSTSYGLSVPGPREDFQVVSPEDLAGEPARSVLADPRHMSVSRRIPVRHEKDALSFLTPLDLPVPEAAEHLPADMQWQVDVVMPGRLLPTRPAIRGSTLLQVPPGGIPDAIVRAGRHGVSFSSANMGLVLAGGPPESRLAHPMLRFPSAEHVFIELAAARGQTIQRSDAGRRAANATELWGSFDAIIADLGGPARRLLDAFLPGKKDADYGSGYAIRGQGYLHFGHAERALGLSQDDTRDVLDRLTSLNVLRRGLLLSCERCRWQAFYPVGQVGKAFRCAACSHDSDLAAGTWYKKDPEPAWNYSLDQVVRTLLEQHGDIPMLAAERLRRGTRDFMWAPELSIQQGRSSTEIDICAIVNGRVVVGEAKVNGRLDSSGKSPSQAADRLVRAAHALTADEIVLATTQPAWAPGSLTAVETSLASYWQHGPRPAVNVMVSLGQ